MMRPSSCWPSAIVLAVAIVVLVAACGGDGGSDGTTGSNGASGPADGAEVYARSCASCHGEDLRGTDEGPSHLSMVYEPGHHTDGGFRAAIEQGSRAHHWNFGDMPPVPGLSDEEIDAVIAFIRDQQEEHGLEPYPPPP